MKHVCCSQYVLTSEAFLFALAAVVLWQMATAFAQNLQNPSWQESPWSNVNAEYVAIKDFSDLINKAIGIRVSFKLLPTILFYSRFLSKFGNLQGFLEVFLMLSIDIVGFIAAANVCFQVILILMKKKEYQ